LKRNHGSRQIAAYPRSSLPAFDPMLMKNNFMRMECSPDAHEKKFHAYEIWKT